MGVSDRLRRFAFAQPTAFPVVGWDGTGPLLEEVRRGLIQPVRAPHDSDLMLLSGRIPKAWSGSLRSLFETLAVPRLAVWLRPERGAAAPEGLPLVEVDAERLDLDILLHRLLIRLPPTTARSFRTSQPRRGAARAITAGAAKG